MQQPRRGCGCGARSIAASRARAGGRGPKRGTDAAVRELSGVVQMRQIQIRQGCASRERGQQRTAGRERRRAGVRGFWPSPGMPRRCSAMVRRTACAGSSPPGWRCGSWSAACADERRRRGVGDRGAGGSQGPGRGARPQSALCNEPGAAPRSRAGRAGGAHTAAA